MFADPLSRNPVILQSGVVRYGIRMWQTRNDRLADAEHWAGKRGLLRRGVPNMRLPFTPLLGASGTLPGGCLRFSIVESAAIQKN